MIGRLMKIATSGVIVLMLIAPAGAADQLHVQRISGDTSAQNLKFTYAYPRFEGITDSQNLHRLNVMTRERVAVAQRKAEFAALNGATEGSYDFEIKRNAGGILSIVLNGKLANGGKTELSREGLTVDTVSGKVYKIGNLFFENADYIGIISESVEKQIRQRGLEGKQLHDFKQIKSNESFYLTNDALIIVMAPKTYFPEDCGIQEFTIQLKSLEGSLEPSLRLCT